MVVGMDEHAKKAEWVCLVANISIGVGLAAGVVGVWWSFHEPLPKFGPRGVAGSLALSGAVIMATALVMKLVVYDMLPQNSETRLSVKSPLRALLKLKFPKSDEHDCKHSERLKDLL